MSKETIINDINIQIKQSVIEEIITPNIVGDILIDILNEIPYDFKTFNGESIVGNGNITVTGGGSGVTSTLQQVTTALGYTPYNATNPSGFITASALTPYLTSSTASSTYQPIGVYNVGNNTSTPNASNEGTFRYIKTTNSSSVEMVMQTGATTYEWVNILYNTW